MEQIEIKIDGEIGHGSNSYEYFKYLFNGLKDEPVKVIISSFGGSFADALKIYSLLKRHNGTVTTVYDVGMSASAATIIACGGSVRIANENALGLIHKVLTPVMAYSYMNEDDIDSYIKSLEKEKEDLVKMTNILVNLYMTVAKVSRETIVDYMTNEEWLTAGQMKEIGLVTEIEKMETDIETVEATELKNQFAFVASKYNLPELPKQFLNKTKKQKMNLVDTIANWFKSSENLNDTDATNKASNLALSLNDAIKSEVDAKINTIVASKNLVNETTVNTMQERIDAMQTSFELMQTRLENFKPQTVDNTDIEDKIATLEMDLSGTVEAVTEMASNAIQDKNTIATLSDSIANLKGLVGTNQINSKKVATTNNGLAPIEANVAPPKVKSDWLSMGEALFADLG